MKNFFKNNGLSIVMFLLFAGSLTGQVITGLKQHNEQVQEEGGKQLQLGEYLLSGHFLQSTFENWESEFLQMALLLILSMFLYQKGSSESKDPDTVEEVDQEPDPRKKGASWPVKKGGLALMIYKHSLCYALSLLFILSFCLHVLAWQPERLQRRATTQTQADRNCNAVFE
jgi:hypothetical protein